MSVKLKKTQTSNSRSHPLGEELYRLLMENSGLGIAYYDTDGKILMFNHEAIRNMSGKLTDYIGKNLTDVYGKEAGMVYMKRFKLVAKSEIPLHFEDYVELDGKPGWYSSTDVRILNEKGEIVCIQVIAENITERKKTELKLLESEAGHRSLFENSLMGISQVNPEGKLIRANRAYLNMYGYDRLEDMINEVPDIRKLYANPDDRKKVLQHLKETGSMEPTEFELIHRTGEKFYALASVKEVRDSSGKLLYMQAEHINITSRKKAESELSVNQYKLNLALRSAEMGVWYYDVELNKRFFDKQTCKLFDIHPAKFKGSEKEFFKLIHPDDRKKIKIALIKAIAFDIPYNPEYRILQKDGSVRHLAIRGKLIRGADGNPEGIHGVVWDITDRLIADQKIRENEEKFRAIFESVGSGLIYMTRDGRILDVNPAMEKITGLGKDSFLGRNALELAKEKLSQAEASNLLQTVTDALRDKPSKSISFRFNDKFLIGTSFISRDKNMIIFVIDDHTEQKNAQVEKLALLMRHRAILGAVPDILMEVNLELVYTWANEAGYAFFGNNVIGKNANFYFASDIDISSSIHSLFSGTETTIYIENWQIRADGEKRLLAWRCRSLKDSGGNTIGAISLARDITETKEREIKLEGSRDQMQQLNLYLQKVREEERRLIARELHDDLGQALTAIKIDLNWLTGQIPPESEESSKVSGMIELVTDTIHDVQRISSELRPLILDDLGLAAAIEWYCEEFSERTALNVKLEINDVQSELMSTNLAIYRVLQESLTNIIRHAEARNVQVNLFKKNNEIILKVQDDGKGISGDKLNSNKSLGLLGMFERVKQSHGIMEISAPANGGTMIKIIIPIK